ncbi:hypothetical protein [Sinorhizobium meliloti]|uniref:hypothetical protein n=1 Tax=Rhizobium meliloti TaxID=382 RepID=UPI0004124074|nr:hypothetical protein [Sinorhizobium meliloti]UDU18799.1 hypothetical protein LJD24_13935 [Sinorhizobium meliloti]
MAGITTWMRHHLKAAFIAVAAGSGIVGTAAGTAGTYYFGLQQSRVDRFADSLMEEYKAVAESKRELYVAIDQFTFALAKGKEPEPAVVTELNQRLLDLHQRIDVFSLGLTDEDKEKVADVKAALANMKIEAAQAKSKADLPYFTGRLAQFENAYQAARPIVERKIGTPNELLAG